MDEPSPSGSNAAVLNRLAAVARRTAFETGDTSVSRAEAYGPAPYLSIELALHPDTRDRDEHTVPGAFYLLVVRGDLVNPRAGTGPREQFRHYATAAQTWSSEWGYQRMMFRLADSLPATLDQLEGPFVLPLADHQPVGPLVDHGPRYQVLDHAADALPLWECRHGIVVDPSEGEAYTLHRERTPAELRPELERLLDEGLVELGLWSDAARRPLSRDETREPLADDRNWHAPYDLGEDERRSVAYRLVLTNSGREEIRQEHARTQKIDGRLGQRTDLHLVGGAGMLRRPPLHPD